MTLPDIQTMLTSISGFSDRVAYEAFPNDTAPEPPYIAWAETGTSNFAADGTVYNEIHDITVELYSKLRDLATEAAIESAFASNGLYWDKTIDFVYDENIYVTTYNISI